MSYFTRRMHVNEKIVYRPSIHWGVFFFPIAIPVIGIILGKSDIRIGLFLYVIFCFLLVRGVFFVLSTEYVLTNKRLLLRTWEIYKQSSEICLNDINGYSFHQSFLGLILGYAHLYINDYGEIKKYKYIRNHRKFREELFWGHNK